MNTMKIEKFLTKALDYATSIYKLHEKLNLLISKNIQEKNEWQKNIEYIHLVEEMEKKLYDSILPVSLIWIKTAKEKLLEMHLEKKSKNVLNFYIEGDNLVMGIFTLVYIAISIHLYFQKPIHQIIFLMTG